MAVYTNVSNDAAAAFMAAYELGTFRELIGIKQGVSNSNYFLITSEGRYVLTLYEKRTSEADLPFFLGLMEHLALEGMPCPIPLRNKKGEAYAQVAGRPAAIFGFLPGTPLMRATPEECAEVGRAMARLHLAGGDFKLLRANALSLDGWEKLFAESHADVDGVRQGLGKIIADELTYLRAHWPTNLPRGVIHADMFPNNVFFNGPKLCGVIDFYFACNDLFAYDLAIALNAWGFEGGQAFNITKARMLVSGYHEIRPLSREEIEALPILARGAAMRFLSTRLYDWLHQTPDALVKPLDPLEYLAKLQFHQRAPDLAAYGVVL